MKMHSSFFFAHKKRAKNRGGSKRRWRTALLIAILAIMALVLVGCAEAQMESQTESPFGGILGTRTDTLDIMMLLTALSFLPALLIMLTAFTRIIIVLGFVKNAMGTQQMPPQQVLIGLALFLTFFVMQPVIADIDQNAYQPYVRQEITQQEALSRAEEPLRAFMLRQLQVHPKDLDTFIGLSGIETPVAAEDVPFHVIIPAFITSEIKTAFQMGFFIYIPFIVVDMVVASTLMSMGMMMLPPIMISLPFKVLIFVMVDGWLMIVQTLVGTFY